MVSLRPPYRRRSVPFPSPIASRPRNVKLSTVLDLTELSCRAYGRLLPNKDLVERTPRHLLNTAYSSASQKWPFTLRQLCCRVHRVSANRTTLTADINCEFTASTCCPSDLALCGDFCSTHPTVWSTSRRRQTTCEVCVDIADSEHRGCTR